MYIALKLRTGKKANNIGAVFIDKINTDGNNIQAEHPPFHASEASDSLYTTKQNVASFFLIGTFLGVIFFIGAGSVLYFRMHTDLTNEQEKVCNDYKNWFNRSRNETICYNSTCDSILCPVHYGIHSYDVCDKDAARSFTSLVLR